MEYIVRTLTNLVHQTAFMNLSWGNILMIAVACVFLYLAIAHDFEPLLLVPIAFGMLLVNIYPDIIVAPTETANGGLLYYFYILDEWAILPSLIFMGVGAMTDFGPLIANPKSFLLEQLHSSVSSQHTSALSHLDLTERQLLQSPSSAVQTARLPSSFARSWDRRN